MLLTVGTARIFGGTHYVSSGEQLRRARWRAGQVPSHPWGLPHLVLLLPAVIAM